ncbi:hypothetical protein [Robertmurraya massiliosenegalensis]|uniref:hypothetical protein n=1 Tax=Robertmurraya massiliosenegalensis TaxID=1287657 RepID=UPI000309A409|nr:hypothetical protein [Robertmurraya massiliosenegalensis]
MKKRLLEFLLTLILFYLYFQLGGFIFNRFVPFNPTTDLLALFLIILLIPISMITVFGVTKLLKKD